jgi:hypothetical protein
LATLRASGRVAQRESARFTRGRSLVRSQSRPSLNETVSRVPDGVLGASVQGRARNGFESPQLSRSCRRLLVRQRLSPVAQGQLTCGQQDEPLFGQSAVILSARTAGSPRRAVASTSARRASESAASCRSTTCIYPVTDGLNPNGQLEEDGHTLSSGGQTTAGNH